MTDGLRALLQLLLLVPGLLAVTFAALRLLGVRRSWGANLASAGLGALVGVAGALVLADGSVRAPGFIRNSLALTFVMTMVVAVGTDLLARPWTLARPLSGPAARGVVVPGIPHPLARLANAVQDARRTREIMAILAQHGFGPTLGLRGRRARREAVQRVPTEERVRSALEQCGGMFVKLGQMASTRTDLLPPPVIEALSHLQSHVAPEAAALMRPVLESELGAPVEEVFAEFDWSPLAAASIAQVYRARLRSGEPVIVKVQRPNVAELVRRDNHVLLRLAQMAENNSDLAAESGVLALAEQFTASLERELDFRIEARVTEAIGRNMAKEPEVRVPRVHDDLCTARVMVEERLDGVNVADQQAVTDLGVDREHLADVLLRAALTQMMVDGLFHADLHPGNVMVLADGSIGMIDFGNTGALDPLLQASLRHMIVATGLRDAAMLRQAVSEVADIGDDVDPDALERALSRFLAAHVVAGGAIGAEAIHDLMQLLLTFGIRVPAELTTFSRALVVLEGTLGTLSPGYQLADHARDLADEWAVTPSVGTFEELARKELLGLVPYVRQLPRRVDRVTDLLERGVLTTRVSLFATPGDAAFVTRLVNRFTLGFLGAVLGVISAMLLGTERGPVLADGTQLLHILGAVGLFSGAVLMLRVVAAILRDGLN